MIRWIVLGITASFLVGFIVGAKKIFPYEPIRSSYLIAHSKMKQEVSAIKNFSSCTIEEIKNVPNSSTAFIGHAYGSSSKNNFIAKNVSNFIEKNSHLLSSIVFTGDVFVVPSSKKWLQLEEIGSDQVVNWMRQKWIYIIEIKLEIKEWIKNIKSVFFEFWCFIFDIWSEKRDWD